MSLFSNPAARILTLVLLLQGGAYYAVALRSEATPAAAPLATFPKTLPGGLAATKEFPLEPEVQAVLRADDTLNRIYLDPERHREANLFIAFFRTQRSGQAPHSPKNCLPGAGWEPVMDGSVTVAVPDRAEPVTVNQYIVARGDQQSLVLYWYQSHNRVIASEYAAKFWLVLDSIRYHRSDTALVRIIEPVIHGDAAAAQADGVRFLQSVFPEVVKWAAQ
jgi:EpsI family protein